MPWPTRCAATSLVRVFAPASITTWPAIAALTTVAATAIAMPSAGTAPMAHCCRSPMQVRPRAHLVHGCEGGGELGRGGTRADDARFDAGRAQRVGARGKRLDLVAPADSAAPGAYA